jgi:hypothetical protein
VMAKELGETTDPKELVPGNPDAITTTLNAMRGYGDALYEAGTGSSVSTSPTDGAGQPGTPRLSTIRPCSRRGMTSHSTTPARRSA